MNTVQFKNTNYTRIGEAPQYYAAGGQGYGAGGGGGGYTNTGSQNRYAGGNGTNGLVYIEWK